MWVFFHWNFWNNVVLSFSIALGIRPPIWQSLSQLDSARLVRNVSINTSGLLLESELSFWLHMSTDVKSHFLHCTINSANCSCLIVSNLNGLTIPATTNLQTNIEQLVSNIQPQKSY